jgi:hypothetical protein
MYREYNERRKQIPTHVSHVLESGEKAHLPVLYNVE